MTVVVKRPWNFATFSNILSETFMPNLVVLTSAEKSSAYAKK